MTPVSWTKAALVDLELILIYAAARNLKGAATIAARVREAELTISTFPRAARRDPDTGAYEAIVHGLPLLLIYELIMVSDESQRIDIIAVFNTDRAVTAKPGRRGPD